MLSVRLIAFGRLKTPGLRDSADYYRKLLRSWVSLDEIELKPVSVPDKSAATRARIQAREEEELLAKLDDRAVLYLMDEKGRALPTRDWAAMAREWESLGASSVAVCIGSSLGFSDALRKRARGIFSLGPQTMSHELARVVILEQLYRAWSVVRGHPYHNEG